MQEDISFVIEANKIVGDATGSGKTTLADVILGLLHPEQGEILIDDVPLHKANRRAWQSGIGYVPQQIYMSDDTVARNVPNIRTPNWGHPDEFFQAAHLSTFSPNTLRRLLDKTGSRVLVLEPAGRFLRAAASPTADGVTEAVRDDPEEIAALIARRRRLYGVSGFWRDRATRGLGGARRLVRRLLLSALGRRLGRAVIERRRGER